MLKKSLRLRKKEDFDRVFRFGRVIFLEEIACHFFERPEGNFRLGFSLSKKQLPLAVERNRFRRVLAASIARSQKILPKATDVVVSLRRKPKKDGSQEKYASLIPRLLEALHKPKK